MSIIEVGGLKFDVERPRDEGVLRTGIEQNVYGIPNDLVDKVVVDVGAFVGGISILAASCGAVVYAIEPSKANYKLLCKNINLNEPHYADLITTFNMALGQHEGKTRLIDINNSNPASNVLQGLANEATYKDSVEAVETKTLKEFFTENGITECDILKLDCEGAEGELVDDIVEMHEQIHEIVAELHTSEISRLFGEKLSEHYDQLPIPDHREVRFKHK